ncbi:PKD domain-containing protein [Pinibacter soli]|uniref:PKD domain-containing protein n=1 Tax=Pinibacter soli TaxID=3044211 RepID=A0ABT6RI81_9BACT|nr:PKD domain-containing protein [Pinibacter soli]MDI3322283.1 PKD domain-containing protein [Pinibacter soli]
MKNLLIIVGMVCLSLFAKSQEIARSLVATNGKTVGFYEYKPTSYTTSKKYPLIIFLHGIGERGNGTTDLYKVNANCIPRYIAGGSTMTFTNPNTGVAETFLVLCPQLDVQYGSWETFYVDEMLKYAKSNLSVDQNRIFLCGISLGGGGVWKYATNSLANAQQFAGIIPCCGTGEGTYYCNIADAKTAVWAFHAMDDGTVGVGNTQYAQIKLGQCNPTVQPKFTYYSSGGHGIWDMAFDQGHGYQNPNVYEWMLTLSRANLGGTTPVVPANVLPVANAGANQAITLPVSTVTLNGTGSTDSDGSIASYSWTKVSGPSAGVITSPSSSTTTVTGLIAGTYVYQLTVTDNSGGTSSANVTISVNAAAIVNVAPTAVAGANQTITLPTSSVTLDGSASKDPDGSISRYAWAQVSGPSTSTITSPTTASTQVTSLVAGTYVYQLTVYDNNAATATSNVSITVNAAAPGNKAPVANAGNNFSTTNNYAYLSGGASYDPDGSIAAWAWSQVSGPNTATLLSGNTMFPTVKDLIGGTYVFQLTVTDNQGASASATVSLSVGGNKQPVASAGGNFNVQLPQGTVTLDGSLSYDPDGTISSYSWTKVSGPTGGTIVTPTGKTSQLTGLIAGTYIYQVQVTDNGGLTATSQVTVTVFAANSNNKAPYCNAGNGFTSANNYVYLSGGASYDPDGKITSWAWNEVSGPNTASVLGANTMFPTVQGLIAGTYVFNLVVTDDLGATASAQVSFTITSSLAGTAIASNASVVSADTKAVTATSALSLSPNPAQSYVNLVVNNETTGKMKVVIFDATGKAAKTIEYTKGQFDFRQQIDVTGLSQGVYYVQIVLDGKSLPTQKFVKL